MTSKELREQRAKLVAEARSVLDTATKANRAPTAEENTKFDAIMKDADALQTRYESIEKLEAAERSIKESAGRQVQGEQPGSTAETREHKTPAERRAAPEYATAFDGYLKNGQIAAEHRALSADNNVTGGYLVTPQQFIEQLIKFVDNMTAIRGLATKYQVGSAESLGAPALDADPADAQWTSELATGNEDSTMAFGKRELHPHPLAKRIKVSEKLLRKVGSAESLVRDRLAYKFAVTEEQAFMSGNGAGQPLGLFTASNDGVSTGRDVSTGNTTTAITMDGLINALYSLKGQYRNGNRAKWLFHRDAIKMIRKLRTDEGGAGTGDYLWQPSVVAGQPDSLLNIPVIESEYVPNTFTTGLYVGMIGDFSNYWIADALGMTVKRLDELYAETAQVGFIGRLECDGMPVLEEAFARVKLA